MNEQEHTVPIRAYSQKELAALYGVSWMTFHAWLKPLRSEIGEKHGHFFTVKQVTIIFNEIGWPALR
jgi:hypothetical protein